MGVFMVKQEAKIIERCLAAAAPFVDAFLVTDTGSSDETVALAEAYCAAAGSLLRVAHHAWRNFGHNRTLSFEAARAYARRKKLHGKDREKALASLARQGFSFHVAKKALDDVTEV